MDCYVLTLRRRPHVLAQFMRRWARATTHDVIPFYALEDSDPVRSCYDSHLQLLSEASEPIAVFEEDAVFSAAFTLDVTPPERAAILYLGGQNITPAAPVDDDWVRPTRINRTHAYIAQQPQALAHGLAARTHRHVDDALDALALPKLALAHFTVGQASGLSSITGQVTRTHRFWND